MTTDCQLSQNEFMEASVQHLAIDCRDNFRLAASVYSPSTTLKAAVLIGPATGIKRQFYHHFANYLAEQGYGVLTFDNRGIGESIHGDLNHGEASLKCWGEKDMSAALSALQGHFPDVNYHLVGHSAGGQLVGLMDNCQEISSIFNFACSSGQLRNMKPSYKYKAHFFMNMYIPTSNLLFGHVKSQWVGMGEPLPKLVGKQWRDWCNGQGYVKTAFGKEVTNHWYDELAIPSMWVNAVDDDIANNTNVDDMTSVFTKMTAERLELDPADHQLDEIGHMKFFSRKADKLWQITTDWLEKYS